MPVAVGREPRIGRGLVRTVRVPESGASKKIGVLIVAYNAASTLASVLDRIPVEFRRRITDVIVSDDSSSDATYLVGLGYKQVAPDLPMTVIRNERNLGYGGNQKVGYRLAIERGFDIIVLLHGDGQYAPEVLPDIVLPIEREECDAVLGSRMMNPRAARRGGMPLYKWIGNKILTRVENSTLGMDLSEFHSGYRAYSVDALRQIEFESNSDGFDFDTQIIIQMHDKNMRIKEIPIPTYYGDEICYVDGLRYARDVVADVVKYRMSKAGPITPSSGRAEMADIATHEYSLKHSPLSSHGRILKWFEGKAPLRVLDLGCSSGLLTAQIRSLGHHVTGVDAAAFDESDSRMDRFVQGDLENGIPAELDDKFDVIVAADVLEHIRRPEMVLSQMPDFLETDGRIIVSIPNFAHWYPRFRVLAGRFDYDDQGILDRGHVRFFTRRSFERMVSSVGLEVLERDAVGVPFERIAPDHPRWSIGMERIDGFLATTAPGVFAYQLLFELAAKPLPVVQHRPAMGSEIETDPSSAVHGARP